MTPFGKLVLLVLLVVVVIWIVTRLRDRGPRADTGAPIPVQDLPQRVRESIDHQLSEGRRVQAIKIYRDATKAPLTQAKRAVDARDWGRR